MSSTKKFYGTFFFSFFHFSSTLVFLFPFLSSFLFDFHFDRILVCEQCFLFGRLDAQSISNEIFCSICMRNVDVLMYVNNINISYNFVVSAYVNIHINNDKSLLYEYEMAHQITENWKLNFTMREFVEMAGPKRKNKLFEFVYRFVYRRLSLTFKSNFLFDSFAKRLQYETLSIFP